MKLSEKRGWANGGHANTTKTVLDSERNPGRHEFVLDGYPNTQTCSFVLNTAGESCGQPRDAEVHQVEGFAESHRQFQSAEVAAFNAFDAPQPQPEAALCGECGHKESSFNPEIGACEEAILVADNDVQPCFHHCTFSAPAVEAAAVAETPLTVEAALAELREMFPRMYCFIDLNQRGHVRYDNGEIGVITGVVIGVQLINEDLRCAGANISEAMQKVRDTRGKGIEP